MLLSLLGREVFPTPEAAPSEAGGRDEGGVNLEEGHQSCEGKLIPSTLPLFLPEFRALFSYIMKNQNLSPSVNTKYI